MIVNQTPYPLSFAQEKGQTLIARYGEEGRQYVMQPDVDVSGLVASLQIVKPDNTFVIASADIVEPEKGPAYIVCTIPLQATAVKGIGHYSLYIQDDADMIIYSAEGQIWVDDHLITDEMLESIAEVYGLRFPQDFLTVENLVDIVAYVSANLINDNTTAENTTWSSQKIDDEISQIDISVSETATGNPIEITDAAAAPLVKCVTEITGYQSGTGTPSPDNIRPIVAYTEGEIEVRGKNLFNPSNVLNAFVSESGGVYSVANLAAARLIYAKCEPNTKYTISKLAGVRFTAGYTKALPQNGVEVFGAVNQNTQSKITISAGSEAQYIVAFVYNSNADTVTAETMLASCMIEKGDTATAYEAYKGTTHTTTYPNAIYRGSEDCVNGTVTTEWGMIASYAGETLPGEWISDRDEYVPGTTPTTGAQVAYELATHTTALVAVSNAPIKSISGYNHIESSTGNMEIEYIKEDYQPLVDSIERGSFHYYSQQEHVVGKWIDGKTVYEKTLTIPWAAATETSIPHGITDFGELIDVSGKLVYNSQYIPIPYVSTNVLYNIGVGNANATKIDIGVGGGFSGGVSDIALTICYTKS